MIIQARFDLLKAVSLGARIWGNPPEFARFDVNPSELNERDRNLLSDALEESGEKVLTKRQRWDGVMQIDLDVVGESPEDLFEALRARDEGREVNLTNTKLANSRAPVKPSPRPKTTMKRSVPSRYGRW